MAETPRRRLITPDPLTAQQTTLNRRLLLGVGLGLIVVVFGIFLLVLNLRSGPGPGARRPTQVPEEQATGGAPPLPRRLQLMEEYAGKPVEAAPQGPPMPDVVPPPAPVSPPRTQARRQVPPPAPPPFPGGRPTFPLPEPPPRSAPWQGQPPRQAAPAPRQPAPRSKPSAWLFAKAQRPASIPFEGDAASSQARGQGQGQAQGRGAGQLITPGRWEAPLDPTRVLYADMLLHGQLAHAINTEIPGPVLIVLTQQVEDRLSQGEVLLPQYTSLLGEQAGRANFGQERIPITITQAIFPDGEVLAFGKAAAGDGVGAIGLPGNVNNHWVKLGIGAVLSAVTNIGVRAPFGSTQGFNPTLQQEAARDIGQGLQRPIDRAIQQRFMVPPTITQKEGFPVTIRLTENISLQSSPILVTR